MFDLSYVGKYEHHLVDGDIKLFLLFICLVTFGFSHNVYSEDNKTQEESTFTLTSTLHGQITSKQVYNGFGCNGENISPSLSWINAPEETKSFAVTMYDPDAPSGSGWWHWVVFDIPANITKLAENAGNTESDILPDSAIQSVTDFGTKGYGGACPPIGHGAHQYIITIHALNTESLGLDENAMPALVGYMINQHSIAKASVISYFERN